MEELRNYLAVSYHLSLSNYELEEMFNWIIDNRLYELSEKEFASRIQQYVFSEFKGRFTALFEHNTAYIAVLLSSIKQQAAEAIQNKKNK